MKSKQPIVEHGPGPDHGPRPSSFSRSRLQGFFRALLLGALASALAGRAWSAEPRLNVLLIMADDLNTDVGCYGHALVRTPNLDRLAARSVRFERAYCQYPVCNPSRTSFLSGLRPTTTGVFDNKTPPRSKMPDVVFLPEQFRRHGYRTLKIGKIFHTGDAFEDPRSWVVDIRELRTSKMPPPEQSPAPRGEQGLVIEAADSDTWEGFVARTAVELLADAGSTNDPFFLAVGFRRPHSPYIAPRSYHEQYPAAAIPPLDEPPEHLEAIPRLALTYDANGRERLTREKRPEEAGAYYASIAFFDAQLGLVLDALDRRGLWNNTIVIFMSDHGYHLGEHGGLWHKNTLFENSCRVPLLIAAPGRKPGVSQQVAELVDLYPTLCELCDVRRPERLEGRSLRAALDNPAKIEDRAAFTVVSRGHGPDGRLDAEHLGRSLRTNRWRYTAWFDGSEEMYDYESDPHEFRNVAKSPENEPLVREFRRMLSEIGSPAPSN